MRPINPHIVLAAAILLPGGGQVLNREPWRGLTFLFFTILLGAFTLRTAAPDVSLVGKLAGGLFVHAMAILDAYKRARIRMAVWSHRQAAQKGGVQPADR
jgi:urea transporter